MIITPEQLQAICLTAEGRTRTATYAGFMALYMPQWSIDTPLRAAHFLAQVMHESGEFRYVRELASGQAYEGRKDLGDTAPGDGVHYKGRGLIQITGKANYKACGDGIGGIDLVAHPEQLETPDCAAASACWFWQEHGCNELADREDFKTIIRHINGGLNGYDDRLAYLMRAKKTLGVQG